MEKKIQLLNDIFEVGLTDDDLEKDVEEVLPWDSFYIMEFLVKAEEEFHKRITIEEISGVGSIKELLQLMGNE